MTKSEATRIAFLLARKLGKMPTNKDLQKIFRKADDIEGLFGGYTELKKAMVSAYPAIEDFIMPARLTTDDLDAYRISIEKKLMNDKNKAFVKKANAYNYVEHFSDRVFSGKIKPYNPPKPKETMTRALFLTLSDLHFGSDIDTLETGHQAFGKLEESRRFAEVIKQTIEYKPEQRSHTELHVNLLGDIIKSKLHDPQDGAPMSEQVCRAIHLLTQGLAHLAEHFPKVTVHCATGNHGRDLNRHQGRATSAKWDSVETVIYYAIKAALKAYPNMTVDIPKTPFSLYTVLGHKIYATHGDTGFNVGAPGKTINVRNIEQQINNMNASLPDREEVKLIFVGHVHTGSIVKLNCGANLVVNGALTPIDSFCVSIGINEGKACQTLVECTAEYPLGDVRMIEVGPKQDRDKSLDKLITPWESF